MNLIKTILLVFSEFLILLAAVTLGTTASKAKNLLLIAPWKIGITVLFMIIGAVLIREIISMAYEK